MNRLLLSCLACLVLYGTGLSGQYHPGGVNPYGAPDSLNGGSFEGGKYNNAINNNDHDVRPSGGSSTGALSDHHQTMVQPFAATSTRDSQPSDRDRNGGDYSGGAPASGGQHGTGGHGKGGTNMAAENAPRIKLILEEDYGIKLVVKGRGVVQIQKVVLDVSPNYGHKWTVRGCKRGTDDIDEGFQQGTSLREGENGTKRWVECGVDGKLRRSMEPGQGQNQLKTLLKDLHISGGDVRGAGWTEEDGGQHAVKEVELKQTGGGRWIMGVVTGSKREKPLLGDSYWEAPWVDEEEEEDEEASGGHLETGGYGNRSTNMVTENTTSIKLILEDKERIKLVMEGGEMVNIQEVVFDHSFAYGYEWAVKSCKRGRADVGEESQPGMFIRDGEKGTKRWVECGIDGHLRRSMESGQVQNHLKTQHITGGDVRGDRWTEEDRGEHEVKEVELKQTGGGKWLMEVVTGSKREEKRSDDFEDEYWSGAEEEEPYIKEIPL